MSPLRAVSVALLATFLLSGSQCRPRSVPASSLEGGITETATVSAVTPSLAVPGAGTVWVQGAAISPQDSTQLALMNDYRAKRSLQMLTWNNGLGKVALAHNNDMAAKNYLSKIDSKGFSLFTNMASSTPPILSLVAAIAVSDKGNSWMNYLTTDTEASALLNDPRFTHVGYAFRIDPGSIRRAIIFAQNAAPQ